MVLLRSRIVGLRRLWSAAIACDAFSTSRRHRLIVGRLVHRLPVRNIFTTSTHTHVLAVEILEN